MYTHVYYVHVRVCVCVRVLITCICTNFTQLATTTSSQLATTTTSAAQHTRQPTRPMHFLPFLYYNATPFMFSIITPHLSRAPPSPKRHCPVGPRTSITSLPAQSLSAPGHMTTIPFFNPVAGSLSPNSMAGSLLMQRAMCTTNSLPLFPRFLPFLYVFFPFRPISFTPLPSLPFFHLLLLSPPPSSSTRAADSASDM
jgi:hypothetical protein